ncbi:MAG: hypothetical protein QMC98_05295 [Candidatus Thermoplasmatota archaeon]|nr:hypothetical protein [Candidatus Thermoplasmatota archaeon]
MGFEDLTELDKRLYEYIKSHDFVVNKWSTPQAAKALGVKEEEIYQSLSNLARHIKDKIEINYRDGGLRIAVE